MKRALFFAVFAAILAAGSCFGQAKKASTNSQAAPSQGFEVAPVAAANASFGPAHPNMYNFPGIEYPRIEADARVTFRLVAPNATKVQVSIVNEPFDMVKGADGAWTYTSAPQVVGYHNYWFIVDGATMLDPGTQQFIGYGHMCNGYEIPEPGVNWYDLKDVPHGNVVIKNYFAKTANKWRHMFVYTPPGYETGNTRYGVLYLQHGSGEDERVWVEMGRTNVILDNLIAAGKIKPFIVVMESSYGVGPAVVPGAPELPFGVDPNHNWGIGPMGSGLILGSNVPAGGYYADMMVKDLIPFMDKTFRTVPDQAHRAMAGLSMGGRTTASVTMTHLDTFAYIGLLSGGAAAPRNDPNGRGARGAAPPPAAAAGTALAGGRVGDNAIGAPRAEPPFNIKTSYNGAMANPAEFNKKVKAFYFSCGGAEYPEGLRKHQEELIAAGITNTHFYVSPDTAHEWQTWRRALYTFSQLLFK
jgi:enterochelin esterase-like enzyme